MPSHSKAPPPPVFLSGLAMPRAPLADARPEVSPDAAGEPQPASPSDPPPGGWTLAEAARELCPNDWRAVTEAQSHSWMAGPGETNRTEREALKLAFARVMEAGAFSAEGIRDGQLEIIPPLIWRVATFGLGLPNELSPSGADVIAEGQRWRGVRVRQRVAGAPPTPSSRLLETKIYSTGAPGRPTSSHLVEQEARRRIEAGEALQTLAGEANHLAEWLSVTHPAAPKMTPKTIQEKIRPVFREPRNTAGN